MSRHLSDLRVPELRAELERRRKDRHGVKHQLQERLAQAIAEEGHDPEEYLFDAIAEKRTPAKKTSRSGSLQGDLDESMDDVNLDGLVVKDEIVEDEVDAEAKADAPGEGRGEDEERGEEAVERKSGEKREAPDPVADIADIVDAKRARKEDADVSKKSADTNGADAEDSINLDIGEDEFLNEEGEAAASEKKDESVAVRGVADTSSGNAAEENQPPAEKRETIADNSTREEKSHSEPPGAEDSKDDSANLESDKGKDDKDTKKINTSSSASSRNLWVSGLSGTTSAKDLKQLCSRHGKVIGAKVVTNARTPGSRCYGYVTMASAEDANNCIKYLHKTELHGRMILMEKAKSESTNTSYSGSAGSNHRNGRNPSQIQKTPHRAAGNRDKSDENDRRKDSTGKDIKSENESADDSKSKDVESKLDGDKDRKKLGSTNDGVRKESSKSKGPSPDRRPKDDRSRDHGRHERDRHRRPPPPRDFLSFSKIRKEREAQRAREQMRRARSDERRRRAAEQSLRELERRQRAEKHRQRVEKDRLALEREKLRIEREKIEREKHELHRLERERQKLERERLELERLELKRAQMKLEEERAKRNYLYTSGGGSSSLMSRSKQPSPPIAPYEHATSRSGTEAGGNSSSSRFNMPLPPHLDGPAPGYDMPPGSSSNKTSDRGQLSRDRPRERDRRDFKRDYPLPPRHTSFSHTAGGSTNTMKYTSNGSTYEPRQPLPPGTRPRDQRYATMDSNNSRESTGSGMRERTSGNSGHDRSGGTSNTSYRPSESSRRSPKPTSRDHRYSDSTVSMKGDSWQNSSGAESGGRYGGAMNSSGQYGDARFGAPYQSTSFF